MAGILPSSVAQVTPVAEGAAGGSPSLFHHQGIDTVSWDSGIAGSSDPWATSVTPAGRATVTLGAENPIASWNWDQTQTEPTIQLPDPAAGGPGPNAWGSGAGGAANVFPFGQFARNGDIMQVPFIGAYVVEDASGRLIEMNGLPMDAAFAEDSDTTNDELQPDNTTAVTHWREQ